MLHMCHGQVSPEGMVTTCTATTVPDALATTQMADPSSEPDVTVTSGSPVTCSTSVTSNAISATPTASLPPNGDGSGVLPTLHDPDEGDTSADGLNLLFWDFH